MRLADLSASRAPPRGRAADRPARQAVSDELSGAVDRAVAQVAAGRVAAGTAGLDDVIPALEREGFEAPLVEARRRRGEAALSAARRDDALLDLVAAHDLALLHGDRDAIAETMLQLARAVGETPAGTPEAERWLARRATWPMLSGSPRHARRGSGRGRNRRERGARGAELELIVASSKRPLSSDPFACCRCAAACCSAGAFEEAASAHYRGSAYVERSAAPTPLADDGLQPHVSLDGLSAPDEIEPARAMLEIRIAALGGRPLVGDVYLQQAGTAVTAGRMRDAASSLVRAEALHRGGGDDIGLVYDLAMIGHVQLALNDLERARTAYDEALALAERVYGPSSVRVAKLLERDNLPRCQRARRRWWSSIARDDLDQSSRQTTSARAGAWRLRPCTAARSSRRSMAARVRRCARSTRS